MRDITANAQAGSGLSEVLSAACATYERPRQTSANSLIKGLDKISSPLSAPIVMELTDGAARASAAGGDGEIFCEEEITKAVDSLKHLEDRIRQSTKCATEEGITEFEGECRAGIAFVERAISRRIESRVSIEKD